MGRKKKSEKTEDKYEVQVGYVHEWVYLNDGYTEPMKGHPIIGRCYRLIKDDMGYRLHIGRENNDANLDGLFLGAELKAARKDFQFEIELVDETNYLELPIVKEDFEQIEKWLSEGNKDLWDRLQLENEGRVPVIRSVDDLINFMRKHKDIDLEDVDTTPPTTEEIVPTEEIVGYDSNNEHYLTVGRVTNALNIISKADHQMMFLLGDFLEYIASNYNKNSKAGDVYAISKGIHYLMFELNRKKKINE